MAAIGEKRGVGLQVKQSTARLIIALLVRLGGLIPDSLKKPCCFLISSLLMIPDPGAVASTLLIPTLTCSLGL